MAADYKTLQQILQNPTKGKYYSGIAGGLERNKDSAYSQWYNTNIAPLMKPVTQGGAIGPDRYNGFLTTPSGIERSLAERGKQKDPYKALVSMYNSLATLDPGLEGGGMSQMDYAIASKGYDAALGYQYFKDTLPEELKFLADAQIAGKKYGSQIKQGNAANLIAEMNSLVPYGYNVGTKAGKNDKMFSLIAPDLARYGVNSLNDLTSYSVTNPYTGKKQDIFYNKATKTILPTEFGSSMKGEGGTWFQLANVGGKIIPITKWSDTSNAADYQGLAMIAGMLAGPALGGLASSLGGSLAASTGMSTGLATGLTQAGLSGLTQGALSAAMGGDFGQGFLGGAIGSGIGSGVSSLGIGNTVANNLAPLGNTASDAAWNTAISKAIDGALAKGLSGAAVAGLSGGDPTKAGLAGLVSGGVSGFTSGLGANSLGQGVSGLLGNQAGKYAASLLNTATPTPVSPLASTQPSSSTTGKKLYNISGLGLPQQANIKGALTKLKEMGASGFNNVGFV